MSTTPRTDAAKEQYLTGKMGIYGVLNEACQLETELNAMKAEFEKIILLAAQAADRNVELRLLAEKAEAELVHLRADLERFTGHGLLDCHAICDQRDAAVAERDQLRAENEDLATRAGLRLSALDYEKLNAEAFKARAAKAEDELKQMQSSALTWARFAGDKAACADIAEQRAQITERLWKEFITLMDITEESDSGNAFNPNKISSCRAMDGKRLNEILNEARQIVFKQ